MMYLGYAWLIEYFQIQSEPLGVVCLQGRNNNAIELEGGVTERYFGAKYAPSPEPISHIAFALKYEWLNLNLLSQIFLKLDAQIVISFIETKPSSQYARKIGFLFEFLTKENLILDFTIGGNYLPILDETQYVTGIPVNNEKWRLKNNLLGNSDFCPMVIKTPTVQAAMSFDIAQSFQVFQQKYNAAVYRRAFNYLYNKETKSSFEIEREKPNQSKMDRFVTLLTKAGTENDALFLSEKSLTEKQNNIVDARFVANGWRDFQNYIGETLPDYAQLVHYICPPPPSVKPMMEGLNICFQKSNYNSALIVATLVSFGFVFIHPFDDGNGRLHRYLIHDILVRKKAVASGTIIPISAQMLENIAAYDNILEAYSKPLMGFIRFNLDDHGELTIENTEAVLSYFKYPNLTRHCEYMFNTLVASMHKIDNELTYLTNYDQLKNEINLLMDLPDKLLNQLVIFIHQNNGILSKNKRKQFDKLTDEEIMQVEKLYAVVFA